MLELKNKIFKNKNFNNIKKKLYASIFIRKFKAL